MNIEALVKPWYIYVSHINLATKQAEKEDLLEIVDPFFFFTSKMTNNKNDQDEKQVGKVKKFCVRD